MNSTLAGITPILPPVIAQLPSATATGIGEWLVAGACIMVILNMAISLWQKMTSGMKESPPPSETYQRKADCVQFHTALVNEIRAMLQEELRALDVEHRERTDALREELSAIVGGVHRRVDVIFQQEGKH